jgi:hypothetical protein
VEEEEMSDDAYRYVWSWGTCGGKYPEVGKRKGMRCRLLATGAKNAVHIEFIDGYRTITNRQGLRKATSATKAPRTPRRAGR